MATNDAGFWRDRGHTWPLLQQLAYANFVAQVSSAAWFGRQLMTFGDDWSSALPENVESQLMLKKNTKVWAQIENTVLNKKRSKKQ